MNIVTSIDEMAAYRAEMIVSAAMKKLGVEKIEIDAIEMAYAPAMRVFVHPHNGTTIFELVEQPKIKGEENGKHQN